MEKKTPPPTDSSISREPMAIEQEEEIVDSVTTAEDVSQPVAVATNKVMDSSQSYMMFGDSMVRFQSACASLASGLEDEEEKQLQMTIAKRSLREVLDAYLRMVCKKSKVHLIFASHHSMDLVTFWRSIGIEYG